MRAFFLCYSNFSKLILILEDDCLKIILEKIVVNYTNFYKTFFIYARFSFFLSFFSIQLISCYFLFFGILKIIFLRKFIWNFSLLVKNRSFWLSSFCGFGLMLFILSMDNLLYITFIWNSKNKTKRKTKTKQRKPKQNKRTDKYQIHIIQHHSNKIKIYSQQREHFI